VWNYRFRESGWRGKKGDTQKGTVTGRGPGGGDSQTTVKKTKKNPYQSSIKRNKKGGRGGLDLGGEVQEEQNAQWVRNTTSTKCCDSPSNPWSDCQERSEGGNFQRKKTIGTAWWKKEISGGVGNPSSPLKRKGGLESVPK